MKFIPSGFLCRSNHAQTGIIGQFFAVSRQVIGLDRLHTVIDVELFRLFGFCVTIA